MRIVGREGLDGPLEEEHGAFDACFGLQQTLNSEPRESQESRGPKWEATHPFTVMLVQHNIRHCVDNIGHSLVVPLEHAHVQRRPRVGHVSKQQE